MASTIDQVRVLLREAKAMPEDDTPRLVLADWLQDQGDPRGELIALQLQRSRLAEDDSRLVELERRQRQLLSQHVFTWLGPLVDLASVWRFERGLLHVTVRAERLLGDDRADLVHAPLFDWIETLRLTDLAAIHLQRLASSPLLEQLSHLDLTNSGVRHGTLMSLLVSRRLINLRRLTLRGNRISAACIISLPGCRNLHEHCRLDLSDNRLGADIVALLRAYFGDRIQLD